MANLNAIAGLRPVRYLSGAPWNGQTNLYYIPQTDTNAYAIGDPVSTTTGAYRSGAPQVTIGVPGTAVRGVVVACGTQPQDLGKIVIPTNKLFNYFIEVCDDPQVIYEIQESGSGSPLTAASTSLQANFAIGTNNGFCSGAYLNNATVAANAALDLNLMRLCPYPNNSFGLYAKWWVLLQNHELI